MKGGDGATGRGWAIGERECGARVIKKGSKDNGALPLSQTKKPIGLASGVVRSVEEWANAKEKRESVVGLRPEPTGQMKERKGGERTMP